MSRRAAAWLGIMPEIPLTASVPLRRAGAELVSLAGEDVNGKVPVAQRVRGRDVCPTTSILSGLDMRVDLDDPQGFAYALRWGWQHAGMAFAVALAPHYHSPASGMSEERALAVTASKVIDHVTALWVCGDIADDDRLAMARALAVIR